MSTIDPGVEDGIKESAKDIDQDDMVTREETETENLHDPSRWWFASTACPLLAGTLGPIANGFSLCALVYTWRLRILPGKTEATGIKIPDPHWLIAVNVLSLIAALSGNLSLLLNMAHRVRFPIAQPITISGFLLAGVLLVVDMAVLTSSPTYFLTLPADQPSAAHALSGAFYYAIFASVIYFIIGMLMCLTVWGANKGYYEKDFNLTSSQRTLMLQTMMFIAYLLLGALVYSKIEHWEYLDAVYWADVTLLTVGLGDYSPSTHLGRSLLFPFAIGGILIIGLVIGSIRSLVLERGEEKLSARITEKRRKTAVKNVNEYKQAIKISYFAWAEFSTDPSLSSVQRREEEFRVMRKVQRAAERERRYYALITSGGLAILLWLIGAVVFMIAERDQGWTYFNSLYFTYVCLLTIGYGDNVPASNSGKAFFVIWSLLAVPSLTILISNMGDTIVKWFQDLTESIGSITVLPSERGFRASAKSLSMQLALRMQETLSNFTGPGLFGVVPQSKRKNVDADEHSRQMHNHLATRLQKHFDIEEIGLAKEEQSAHHSLERDINFYHYVLARECRRLQSEITINPTKQYSWEEWEYFLKLMGVGGGEEADAKTLVPDAMHLNDDRETFPEKDTNANNNSHMAKSLGPHKEHQHADTRKNHNNKRHNTLRLEDWSWLSSDSPLMSSRSEGVWLLERLGIVLERELNRQRKGIKRQPPVGWADLLVAAEHERENQHKDE